MLVLTRRLGEEILIGDNIKLVVNRIAGNRVTLGINAPGNVTILRGELSAAATQNVREPLPAAGAVAREFEVIQPLCADPLTADL